MKAIILQEAYRLVDIQEGGKKARLPLIQAIIRRQGVSAAQGRPRADALLYRTLRSIEEGKLLRVLGLCQDSDRLIKKMSGKEFERRKKLNPSEPDPVPHPDDIVLTAATGTVELHGPMTKRNRSGGTASRNSEAAIAELEGMLAKDPDNPDNKFIEEELAYERRVRQQLARAVPDYRPRPSRREARQKARLRAFKSSLEQIDSQPARRSHRKKCAGSDK